MLDHQSGTAMFDSLGKRSRQRKCCDTILIRVQVTLCLTLQCQDGRLNFNGRAHPKVEITRIGLQGLATVHLVVSSCSCCPCVIVHHRRSSVKSRGGNDPRRAVVPLVVSSTLLATASEEEAGGTSGAAAAVGCSMLVAEERVRAAFSPAGMDAIPK